MKKAVTIQSIANQLNMSRNTVAKALNGQYVPEKTRQLVIAKAKELNYKSFDCFQTDINRKKYRILLLSGKPLNNMKFFVSVVKGIENYCFKNSYELLQYIYNVDRTPFSSLEKYIKDSHCDGVIAIECFEKSFINKLLNINIPVCFIDFTAHSAFFDKSYDVICSNDAKSTSYIVKRLHKLHNIVNFTFVGDNMHCFSFNERYKGMINELNKLGIKHHNDEDILCNDKSFNYDNPEGIKAEILKLKHRPECFICCNDFVARNVCEALKSMNKKVPQNTFVVGFDDVDEAISLSPQISTFSLNTEFLGEQSVTLLVQRIENSYYPTRTIKIDSQFIERESTIRKIKNN